MVLVWLSALVGIFHPRSRGIRVGWLSKALWVLPLFFGGSYAGYSLPFGALAVLYQLRKGWRELETNASDDVGAATSRPSSH